MDAGIRKKSRFKQKNQDLLEVNLIPVQFSGAKIKSLQIRIHSKAQRRDLFLLAAMSLKCSPVTPLPISANLRGF